MMKCDDKSVKHDSLLAEAAPSLQRIYPRADLRHAHFSLNAQVNPPALRNCFRSCFAQCSFSLLIIFCCPVNRLSPVISLLMTSLSAFPSLSRLERLFVSGSTCMTPFEISSNRRFGGSGRDEDWRNSCGVCWMEMGLGGSGVRRGWTRCFRAGRKRTRRGIVCGR